MDAPLGRQCNEEELTDRTTGGKDQGSHTDGARPREAWVPKAGGGRTRQGRHAHPAQPEQRGDVLRPSARVSPGERSGWQGPVWGTGVTEAGVGGAAYGCAAREARPDKPAEGSL